MSSPQVTSLLTERLEHIPADSIWAHRASGVRGSLLRMMERAEAGEQVDDPEMRQIIAYGFQILEHAAREKTLVPATGKRKALNGK